MDFNEDTEGLRTVEILAKSAGADYGQGEHGDIDEENGLSLLIYLASDSLVYYITSDESSLKEDIRASGAL